MEVFWLRAMQLDVSLCVCILTINVAYTKKVPKCEEVIRT